MEKQACRVDDSAKLTDILHILVSVESVARSQRVQIAISDPRLQHDMAEDDTKLVSTSNLIFVLAHENMRTYRCMDAFM